MDLRYDSENLALLYQDVDGEIFESEDVNVNLTNSDDEIHCECDSLVENFECNCNDYQAPQTLDLITL